jgi:hypothetical protein
MAGYFRHPEQRSVLVRVLHLCFLLAAAGVIATDVRAADLEQPAVFDIAARSGALRETVQKGQALIWRGKEGEKEREFQVDNISVALLRSETGSQVKITFSGNVSSLGYGTSEDAKLNLTIRTKAGAALYSWSFGIAVKCGDSNKPLAPLTNDMPMDIAANVFANSGAVELAELPEQEAPGVKTQRCG